MAVRAREVGEGRVRKREGACQSAGLPWLGRIFPGTTCRCSVLKNPHTQRLSCRVFPTPDNQSEPALPVLHLPFPQFTFGHPDRSFSSSLRQ